ncbi:MAG: ABC transporter substrate-binding protein [Candidatus Bipolaricaulia bacterium]
MSVERFLLLIPIWIWLLCGLGAAEGVAQTAVVDDTGTEVVIENADRVIATSHDLVELMYLMGVGSKLIAVPSWIDYPPQIEALPKLGRPLAIAAEEIIAHDPTLVLEKDSPLQPQALYGQLRAVGIPTVVVEDRETLESLYHTIDLVGQVFGVEGDAQALINELSGKFASLTERLTDVAKEERPRVFFMFPANLTGGTGTTVDLMIRLAGGINVASTAGIVGYQQMSIETILAMDPERVIVTETAHLSPKRALEGPQFQGTTAARQGEMAVLVVDPATTTLTGPRFYDGVLEVARWLHPDRFSEAEASASEKGGFK